MKFSESDFPTKRGVFLPPKGRLSFRFEELKQDGCIQCENDELRGLFAGLYFATASNPCDGCPVWGRKGPECKAFQNHHSAFAEYRARKKQELLRATTPQMSSNSEYAGLTVRQIAEKLGVSLSEVRRRKLNGTL